MKIAREDLKFFLAEHAEPCLSAAQTVYSVCSSFCANVLPNVSKIGVVAGSAILAVNVFQGTSCLYPGALFGVSLGISIGNRFFSRQEKKCFSEDIRSECAYEGILASLICKEHQHSFSIPNKFIENFSKIGMIAGPALLTIMALHSSGYLYRAYITGLVFSGAISISIVLSKVTRPKNLENQDVNDALPWVEFKRWDSVSEVKKYVFSFYKRKDLFSLKTPSKRRKKTEAPTQFLEVRAFTNGVHLKYVVIRKTEYKWMKPENICSGLIQLDHPIDKMIEILKRSFVILEKNQIPTFSLSYHTISGICEITKKSLFGSVKTKEKPARLELLLGQSGLVWNIYQQKSRKVFSIQGIALSQKCGDYTRELFKKARSAPLGDQINLMKFLTLERSFPHKIRLRPLEFFSGFNPIVSVSPFMWAVTLIKYQGFSGNHAEIIIEGVNDGFIPEEKIRIGKYFTFLIHLKQGVWIKDGQNSYIQRNGENIVFGDVQVKFENEFNWDYDARSEVWKRPSDVVKNMVLQSYKEKHDPPEGFSLFGCDSILTSKETIEHSCITWAIEKLKIAEIFLEKKPLHSLFTYTSFYTPINKNLYDTSVVNAEIL